MPGIVLSTLMHYLISHSNTLIEVLLIPPILQMEKVGLEELSTLVKHLHLILLESSAHLKQWETDLR